MLVAVLQACKPAVERREPSAIVEEEEGATTRIRAAQHMCDQICACVYCGVAGPDAHADRLSRRARAGLFLEMAGKRTAAELEVVTAVIDHYEMALPQPPQIKAGADRRANCVDDPKPLSFRIR